MHERERRSVEILPILGEPSAAIEPRNGALPSGCLIEHPRLTSRSIAGGGRGRPHAAARSGSVSALTGAPFGYRYVRRDLGGGVARFEVVEEEAHIVRLIFAWIGLERASMREVCRRLE